MKPLIAIIIISVLLGCFGKNNETSNSPVAKIDTLHTILLYKEKGLRHGDGYRLIQTRLAPDKNDSLKNTWKKDTVYFHVIIGPVPDKNGKPIKTKDGKDSLSQYGIQIPKDSLFGVMNIDVDSLLRIYKK